MKCDELPSEEKICPYWKKIKCEYQEFRYSKYYRGLEGQMVIESVGCNKPLAEKVVTNGEMVMAIFPHIKVEESCVYNNRYFVSCPNYGGTYFLKSWWDSPYEIVTELVR